MRGAIRTGGDDGGGALEGSPPVQKPLALYSGIVEVKPDGTAEVVFDIPAFAGTARVMGVAWTKDRVGKAVGDVIIRDPVVVTATLPRFLNTGDKSTLSLDLDNVEGQAGEYVVTLAAQGPTASSSGKVSDKLTLRAKQRQFMTFPLDVTTAGPVTLTVNVAGPGGFSLDRAYALNVRPATQLVTRRTVRQIAKGESHHALQRHVRRSRAQYRQRRAVGLGLDRARCRHHPEGARPLSVRLFRTDHQPRAAAALCQRSRQPGAGRARHRGRSAHPRCHRTPACKAGRQWRLRAVVGRRLRRSVARCLCHRLPDAGARARLCGAGRGVQDGARPAAQQYRDRARALQGWRPRTCLCALCAGAQRRRLRSATFATSPIPS